MILSEKFEFIFIKGMKVGGTSVEMALSTLCGPNDIVTPIMPIDEKQRLEMGGRCQNFSRSPDVAQTYIEQVKTLSPKELGRLRPPHDLYHNHMPLAEVAATYGKSLSKFRLVFIERCPYSKLVSWMNMRLSAHRYKTGGEMKATLDEIRDHMDEALESGRAARLLNIPRYTLPGIALRTHMLRYETITSDFDNFVRTLNVGKIPSLPHAKKGLMANSLNPKEIFTDKQLGVINALFKEEFLAYDYQML